MSDVLLEHFRCDSDAGSSVLVSVAADTCCDDQIDYGCHLLPVSLLVLLILLLQILNLLPDNRGHIVSKMTRKLLYKLHAVSASRLCVRLFQIVLDVLGWFAFVVLLVLLSNLDVGHNQ